MNKASSLSVGGLVGLTFLSGFILSSFRVSAESVHVSNVSVAVPVSCELSGTNTSHSADVNNGTYREDIGKTTLTVFCNDSGGYAIYAVGYTGEEIGGTNSTKLVGVDSNLTISTGTYTQGTTTDSAWAMKINKVTNTSGQADVTYNPANLTIENGFDVYSAVPAAYTKVASFTSTTDLTLGSKLETTYAAFVSGLQRADTYNGKVKYTLVHPSNAAGNTLYVMQDVASWKNSLSTGQEVNAMDSRDGKFYTVAKLADGNVWMTENLDIAGGTALSSDDTDFESTYVLPTTNNWTVSDGKLILPSSNTEGFNIDDVAFLYNSDSTNCGENSPCYSYYSWDTATLGSGRSISAANQDAPYSICPKGWRLPSTRSGTDSSSDYRRLMIALGGSSNIETYDDSDNASPSGTTMSSAIQASPNNYVYSGFYHRIGFYRGGSYGSYWTSTSSDNSGGGYVKSMALLFDNDTVYTVADLGRMAGYSVRCVAR